MKTGFFVAAGVCLAAMQPATASAQSLPGEGFVGVSGGYHDVGIDEDDADFAGLDLDSGSPVAGVFVGYDLPIGLTTFLGAEANYTHGFDAIDNEIGASARLGFKVPGGAKFYVRGGYQKIDLDFDAIFDEDFDGAFDDIDDEGDYLVGLGADFPLGNTFVRANLDTIAFDTVRATAGIGVKF